MAELEKHRTSLPHEYNELIARMHALGAQREHIQDLIMDLEDRLASQPGRSSATWTPLRQARIRLERVQTAFAHAQDELTPLMPRMRRVQRLSEFLRNDATGPGD